MITSENKRTDWFFWLVVSSGLLQGLLYYGYDLGYFAFFAWVPLILSVSRFSFKKLLLACYLNGLLFYVIGLSWMSRVTIWAWIGICLFMALYTLLFGALAYIFVRKKNIALFLAVPPIWVFVEYLISILFTGFPWLLAGYTLHSKLYLIQIADTTGIWGVSFLVIIINSSIAQIINFIQGDINEKKFAIAAAIVSFFLFILAAVYGQNILSKNEPDPNHGVKVSLVQGNIPYHNGPMLLSPQSVWDIYKGLTDQVEKSDIIIWPETIYIDYNLGYNFVISRKNPDSKIQKTAIEKLAENKKTYFIVGGQGRSIHGNNDEIYFNSAFLISPEGNFLNRYDKEHLVPFGEYMPLKDFLFFLKPLAKYGGNYSHGELSELFEVKELRFGLLICYEDVFPNLVRSRRIEGADVLINLSNDSWFGNSVELYQHLNISRFRAIENRLPIIRCTNSGISAIIDCKGELKNILKKDKKIVEIKGILTSIIPEKGEISTYAIYGEWFIYVLIVNLVLLFFTPQSK